MTLLFQPEEAATATTFAFGPATVSQVYTLNGQTFGGCSSQVEILADVPTAFWVGLSQSLHGEGVDMDVALNEPPPEDDANL